MNGTSAPNLRAVSAMDCESVETMSRSAERESSAALMA
jgi:hypothetical protein